MGPPVLSIVRVFLLVLLVNVGKSLGIFIAVRSFKCTNNKELCPSMTCSSDVSRHRVPMINCGCLLPRPLSNVTVELNLQSMARGRFETLVHGKANLCDIASKSVRGDVITRVFENITKYFKGFKCPFEGNVTATKLPISLSFAPGFMPASDYRLVVDVRNAQDFVLGADLQFAIMKHKI